MGVKSLFPNAAVDNRRLSLLLFFLVKAALKYLTYAIGYCMVLAAVYGRRLAQSSLRLICAALFFFCGSALPLIRICGLFKKNLKKIKKAVDKVLVESYVIHP